MSHPFLPLAVEPLPLPAKGVKKKRTLVQRLSHSFWKRFLSIVYFPGVHIFRFIEHWLGPRCLPWVLAPVIYLDFLHRLIDYPEFKKLHSVLPLEFWRGLTPWRHHLVMSRNWQSTLATLLLADRLHLPHWVDRIKVSGTPPNQLPEWRSRPVLLVYMHTGGYGILRYWMRSQGINAASYGLGFPKIVTLPWAYKIFAKAGATRGISDLSPTFLGPKHLRKMIKFMVPGRLVTIALDAESGSSMIYQAAGKYPICLSNGIVRLAALTNAILLPVSVSPRGLGRFAVRFRTPVPNDWVDEKQPQIAIQFLLDQLWKDVEEEPSVLGWTSLCPFASHLTVNYHTPFP